MKFAFFWVGDDISIPSFLVQSIRFIYGGDVTILQLSDHATPSINGVTEVLRKNLSKYIMLARLEAYSLVNTNKPTCFLDADCLLINKIKLPSFANNNAMLLERNSAYKKLAFHSSVKENYPEFINKNIYDAMPILFAFIATPDGGKLFKNILTIARTLDERFHYWYGDQMAIKIEWENNKNKYLLLNEHQFFYTVKKTLEKNELLSLQSEGFQIIHFKGPESKKFIADTLINLVTV